MKKQTIGYLLSSVLAVAIILWAPKASCQHEYGVASDSFEAFEHGAYFWAGWNGSFSETFAPESETYNWILLMGPTGIFAALTSASSVYSSVDMYAALNGFVGTANADGPSVTWEYYSGLSGITYSHSIDLLPNVLSIDFGATFFKNGEDVMQKAIQFSAGSTFKLELVSIPLLPSVAIDNGSNLTNEDTGFWPVLLWEQNGASADPLAEIINALREVLQGGDPSFVSIHQRQMAQSLLPAFTAMNVTSSTGFGDGTQETPIGDYVGQYLSSMDNATHPEHTIGAAIEDVGEWLDSGDTDAPARIVNEMPISPAAVIGSLRMVRNGVGSGFEAAYRHGYDYAVNAGTRTDDTIYADCLVTQHCLMGDGCILEVTTEEIAQWIPASAAADFEGAQVNFDAAPSEYLESGNAGMLISSTIESGIAEYSFLRNEESAIVLGATVPAATSPGNNGMNLELCARQIIMFNLVEEENVTVIDGTLNDFSQYDPDTLPTTDAPINFTHGFYSFEITPDEPGGTVDIVLDLPTSLAPGYSWAKYSLTDEQWVDWNAADNKKVDKPDGLHIRSDRLEVTITITDNGPYDDDDTLGAISESSGAALFDKLFESVSADDYLTGEADGDSDDGSDTDGNTDPQDTDTTNDSDTSGEPSDDDSETNPDGCSCQSIGQTKTNVSILSLLSTLF